jgi:hypothetical protein
VGKMLEVQKMASLSKVRDTPLLQNTTQIGPGTARPKSSRFLQETLASKNTAKQKKTSRSQDEHVQWTTDGQVNPGGIVIWTTDTHGSMLWSRVG